MLLYQEFTIDAFYHLIHTIMQNGEQDEGKILIMENRQ